jgi:hypothetical protein
MRGRLSVVVLALGVAALARAGATDEASLAAAAEHRLGSDSGHALVETGTIGPGAPAVIQQATTRDDRPIRVLKPVVAAVVLLTLAWSLAVRWRHGAAGRLRLGSLISRCAAPKGHQSG